MNVSGKYAVFVSLCFLKDVCQFNVLERILKRNALMFESVIKKNDVDSSAMLHNIWNQ